MGRARIESPVRGSAITTALATAAWCAERGLVPQDNLWFVEVAFATPDARLAIEIYASEWGFSLQHGARSSWIRVTDVAFVHGRDDFELLSVATDLVRIRGAIETVEARYGLRFVRDAATVRTNLEGAQPAIRTWIATL